MSVLVTIAFWGGTVLLVFAVVRGWKAPPDHQSYQRPPWWFWSDEVWRGYRRTLLPASLAAVCIAIGLTLPDPWGAYFGLPAFVIFFPLMVTIAAFNWPKLLVPPSSRRDKGVISELRRRRTAKKDSI